MKKIISILFFSSTFIIITFLLLSDFETVVFGYLESSGSVIGYAALSFLLLLSDILMPIPSSLVMMLNGKVLGPFWGFLLSLVSGMFSSVAGFYLGRKASSLFNHFFSEKEMTASNSLFKRYGNVSISLSKALPVLSESVTFLAGTTAIPFRAFFLFSFIGQAIVALVYAYVGSMTNAIDSKLVSAIIIAASLLMAWGVQARTIRKREATQ